MKLPPFSVQGSILLLVLLVLTIGGTELEASSNNNRASSSLHKASAHRLHFKHADLWDQWKHKHDKTYESSLHELEHHLVWLSNKEYIDHHNANEHIFGYTLALNHLGDMVSGIVLARKFPTADGIGK